ncbi:MAG TPA: hypothetical protein PK544_09395 [Spirochaetota bacterium]|nr:hypothetical protein [Spirochaetota bacterium]HPQ54163.1 hypothetical protein [Spirochaetota bacterium]
MRKDIKKQIIEDLDHLPLDLQKKVSDFARALVLVRGNGTPGSELVRFSGTIGNADARKIRETIRSECGRIDHNEW